MSSARVIRCGLSPRVRGSLRVVRLLVDIERPIPAGAGEPLPVSRPNASIEAYPRGCGGARYEDEVAAALHGLSPRVRGSLGGKLLAVTEPRPIPAGAGEPLRPRSRSTRDRAYPRGCGGAAFAWIGTLLTQGLSPRVRGSLLLLTRRDRGPRPIPAGAGEPGRRMMPGCRQTAYPRGCGGASRTVAAWAVKSGLSPRVRGSQ